MLQPVLALLRGGPSDIPEIWEIPSGGTDEQVKIPRGNGYEHFEFAREYARIGDELMPVYRWCYRTFIAE
ncbi:DUF5988 family protein [Streptomyces sp. NPDC004647]|uniref:DUF5988 family protein n=1 Tax=Streptomyces sp. NPDC004647 TaxID=3154671 RepID=UPI0033A4D1DB